MARQSNPETVTKPTQVDLSAVNYRFIEQLVGEAGIRLCRARMRADGVLVDADNTTDAQVIVGSGRVKITAGAAFAVGRLIASDAQGRAVPSTQYAGEVILGRAEEAATAAGEVRTIEYFGPGGAGTD